MKRLIIVALTGMLPMMLAYDALLICNEVQRSLLGTQGNARIHALHHEGHCGWECHDNTTRICLVEHDGMPEELREMVKPAYFGFIHLLRSSGNYRLANLVYLALLWPLVLSIATMRCLRLHRGRHPDWKWTLSITVMSVILCIGFYPAANPYIYLTDFILTLSHWSGLSYYDINAIVFVVGWPLLTAFLFLVWPLMEWRSWRSRLE